MNEARYIPRLIVGTIVLFTIIVMGLFYIAQSTYTGTVTENYYQKGLDFGKIYETSLYQQNTNVVGDIVIFGKDAKFSLANNVVPDFLEAKIVKPVADKYDQVVNFEKVNASEYKAALPDLEQGNWELRVRMLIGEDEYIFSKRFIKAD